MKRYRPFDPLKKPTLSTVPPLATHPNNFFNEEENSYWIQKTMESLRRISDKMGSMDSPTDILFRVQLQQLMTDLGNEEPFDNTRPFGYF